MSGRALFPLLHQRCRVCSPVILTANLLDFFTGGTVSSISAIFLNPGIRPITMATRPAETGRLPLRQTECLRELDKSDAWGHDAD